VTDELDIDAIEDQNEAGGYHDQHEIRALVGEVKRLRAALAESQAGEAEWQEHANNYQGHYMRESERCERAEAERDAATALREDAEARFDLLARSNHAYITKLREDRDARPVITREDAARCHRAESNSLMTIDRDAAERVTASLREHAKGVKP
jgi:hypothetical protein